MSESKKGIEYLLELNTKHSELFTDPGLALERRRYRAQHPTEIAALKCMDGRLHLPVMTETTVGVIQPFRNLGGRFDLGWPAFQFTFNQWVEYAVGKGRDCLVLVTYHFARGDSHRGCRGFGYDTEAAKQFTNKLKSQFDEVYGNQVVYALQVGIETDWESLILHGENGEIIDTIDLIDTSFDALDVLLRKMYAHMPEQIRWDLIPVVQGSARHAKKTKEANRSVQETEHKEWVLGIGRGFDWLHAINTAFIVGPFDPDLASAIATAATLLHSNMQEGRISSEGLVLLSSAPYRDEAGPEQRLAQQKAKFLERFALDVIKTRVPDLAPHLNILTGIVNMQTRKLTVL
jgi:hypothetical protein